MKRTLFLIVGALFLMFICASGTLAQSASSRHGIGPYMGFASDPDQFVIGGQGVFGPYASPVHLSPSLDIGFGDNWDVATLNLDITYDFFPRNYKTVFFAGAGPTLAFYSSDRFDDQTEAGLSLIGGVKFASERGNSFNLAARIGVGDIPDIKLTAGYLFALR